MTVAEWLPLLTAVAGAGIALVATSLVEPKGARMSRLDVRLRHDHSLMRDKAEAIFAEVGAIRSKWITDLQDAEPVPGRPLTPPSFSRFETLRALCSIYYPMLAIQVQDLVDLQAQIAREFSERLATLRHHGTVTIMELQQAHHDLAYRNISSLTPAISALERALGEQVRRFVPSA